MHHREAFLAIKELAEQDKWVSPKALAEKLSITVDETKEICEALYLQSLVWRRMNQHGEHSYKPAI